MSSKIKHNKKRNTAFLYEALVRELTKASIKKNANKKNAIISILKEFFKEGKLLARELKLYQNIIETKVDDQRLAEKIVQESRLERSVLDNKSLFNEQSALISRINKELSQEVYSNFVPNYKNLATLQQIFNNPKVEAKTRVLLEQSIIESMTEKQELHEQKMNHIDDLVYQSFIKKFNQAYGNLLENQKQLLKAYIGSVEDDLEMKVFLDDELGRLKEHVSQSEELEIFPEEKKQIADLLEEFSNRHINESDLEKILKIQQLIEESKND